MMWKVKVRLDVIRRGYSKEETFETMMDTDTISKCTSDNEKKNSRGRLAKLNVSWCR